LPRAFFSGGGASGYAGAQRKGKSRAWSRRAGADGRIGEGSCLGSNLGDWVTSVFRRVIEVGGVRINVGGGRGSRNFNERDYCSSSANIWGGCGVHEWGVGLTGGLKGDVLQGKNSRFGTCDRGTEITISGPGWDLEARTGWSKMEKSGPRAGTGLQYADWALELLDKSGYCKQVGKRSEDHRADRSRRGAGPRSGSLSKGARGPSNMTGRGLQPFGTRARNFIFFTVSDERKTLTRVNRREKYCRPDEKREEEENHTQSDQKTKNPYRYKLKERSEILAQKEV